VTAAELRARAQGPAQVRAAAIGPQVDSRVVELRRRSCPRPSGRPVRPRERRARLADALVGRAIPSLRLTAFSGAPVTLPRDADVPLVIYLYPGAGGAPGGLSPHGLDWAAPSAQAVAGRMADAAQHRAFDSHREQLRERFVVKVVGLSSEPKAVQHASVCADRLCHELWSDPELLLADALGLPTFTDEGARRYRRLTLVVSGGRIEKAFFPVESPQRSAAQVIGWLTAMGR